MASFGDTLRRERELRGVELREVADATKISVRFLQALENDRVDILPGGIFPRAFVRQYASYLGLDADRMVAEFVYSYGDESPTAASAPPRGRPRSLRPLLVLLAVLGALGATAWFALRPEASGSSPQPRSAAPASTFAADPVYPPPTTVAALVPTDAQGLVMTLNSRQNCWVAVQVDGVKVMDRILNEGEAHTVKAKNEIVLSVGNAGGITFSINGRPGVSLGREGEVRRNIVITRQSLPSLLQAPGTVPTPRSG